MCEGCYDELRCSLLLAACCCQMGFGGFANAFLLGPLQQLLSSGGALEGRVVPRTLWIITVLFAVQGLLFEPSLGLMEQLAAAVAAVMGVPQAQISGYVFVVLALSKAVPPPRDDYLDRVAET